MVLASGIFWHLFYVEEGSLFVVQFFCCMGAMLGLLF